MKWIYVYMASCQNVGSSNFDYKFNTITVKTLSTYFVDNDKLILKFIWRPGIPNTTWKGKNRVGGLTLPDLNLLRRYTTQGSEVSM